MAADTKPSFVGDFFQHEPVQWGLRGDPFLWREMREKAGAVSIPAFATELENYLRQLFKELTGEVLQKGKRFYVHQYAFGGMSSGVIDCDFWLDKAFPLILQRYSESKL